MCIVRVRRRDFFDGCWALLPFLALASCFEPYSKKRQIVDLGCVKKVMPGLPAEGRVLSAQRAIEPAVVHVQLQAACCKVRVGTARLVSLKS